MKNKEEVKIRVSVALGYLTEAQRAGKSKSFDKHTITHSDVLFLLDTIDKSVEALEDIEA